MTAVPARSNLLPDCGSCQALCCVALPFAAGADFALDKPAAVPCVNLQEDFRCGIHESLRPEGFRGCTVFDCHGAGQKVVQQVFPGRQWRDDPATAEVMFPVFYVVRQLHELLLHLTEALALVAGTSLAAELERALDDTEALTRGRADDLLAIDVGAQRDVVNALLLRASDSVRKGVRRRPADRRGADLVGADLAGADLRAASLRGALLVAADLRGADLREADLTGADLRDADVRGTDLSRCLFLKQSQLQAAVGDSSTTVPASLTRPLHWLAV